MTVGSMALDILQAAGIGVIAVNMFEGNLPPTPDTALVVIPSGGSGNGGSHTLTTERPRFQIITRSKSYNTALSNAYAATKLFNWANRVIGGVTYVNVSPVDNPGYMGLDGANRAQFTVNFDVEKVYE